MSTIPINHNYELIAHDEERLLDSDGSPKSRRRIPLFWRLQFLVKTYPRSFFMSLLMVALVLYALTAWQFWNVPTILNCDTMDDGYQCRPEISHYWGQYSPYFSIPSDISVQTPDTCEINFVQVLSRHGARDPTSPKSILYSNLIKSLHASVESFEGQYTFIKDYRYTLGADQLTHLGQRHMVNSGIKFFNRYKHLALSFTPFIRASGQQRVIDSAHLFAKGYHEACFNQTGKSIAECNNWPFPFVEISEDLGSHNPLDHGLCDAFEEDNRAGLSKKGQDTFRDVFVDSITKRLNENLVGAELENDETIMIMDLCPFETVAHPDGKLSPFCQLFTKDEWKQYDYYQTLGKWYGFGSFNNLGPTQGVGFTNELIARMTQKPVEDHTSVDHHLDDDPKTFPLGDKWRIYADFTHDNDMVSILAAIGIFSNTSPLSNTTVQDAAETNGFSTSWLTPFGGRIYFEKMICQRADAKDNEEYVRVIINDRVQPMHSCGGDERGRCKLSDFLASLSFAKKGGRWDDC